ncbi:MAG: hypothetical protein NT067_06850 [Candidatus Diapherotrites archaeon]|nr:hypothetical protein [Candidatus Diapherotrites archaeon]
MPKARRPEERGKRDKFYEKLLGSPKSEPAADQRINREGLPSREALEAAFGKATVEANTAFMHSYMWGARFELRDALGRYERQEKAGKPFNARGFLFMQKRIQEKALANIGTFLERVGQLPAAERQSAIALFKGQLEKEQGELELLKKGELREERKAGRPFVFGERIVSADLMVLRVLLKALNEKTTDME